MTKSPNVHKYVHSARSDYMLSVTRRSLGAYTRAISRATNHALHPDQRSAREPHALGVHVNTCIHRTHFRHYSFCGVAMYVQRTQVCTLTMRTNRITDDELTAPPSCTPVTDEGYNNHHIGDCLKQRNPIIRKSQAFGEKKFFWGFAPCVHTS